MSFIFKEDIKKTVVRQRLELYQRCRDRDHFRRIASLPNADDKLIDFMEAKYKKPNFVVRVVTELF